MTVITTAQTTELRKARSLLAALSERPGAGLDALPAIEALALLDLVHPPLPPVDDLDDLAAAQVSLEQAVAALSAAARVATDPPEAARIAEAGAALQTPAGK